MNSAPFYFVLHSDDAVDVSFTDGSLFQLSACGTVFVHTSDDFGHLIHGLKRIEQRTRFCTSAFLEVVRAAIDFRNRFASRPFLCREIFATEIIERHDDVLSVLWPQYTNDVVREKNGALTLSSIDKCAHVTLAPCQRYFTARFLAKIGSSVSKRPLIFKHDHVNDDTDAASVVSSVVEPPTTLSKCEGRWDYVWVTQHHSINDCPDEWRHAVETLLSCSDSKKADFNAVKQTGNTIREVHAENSAKKIDKHLTRELKTKDLEGASSCLSAPLPRALPLTCPAPHRHKWASEVEGATQGNYRAAEKVVDDLNPAYFRRRIKVVCLQGVVYRLLRTNTRAVEIYPGDDSVILTSGLSGHFFNHYIVDERGKTEERVYSTKWIPPDLPGFPYSVQKLIARGARFFDNLCKEILELFQTDDEVCWKLLPEPIVVPPSSQLLEQCSVPDLGKFEAYTSGRVRAVFADRTCLDMHADFAKRLCRNASLKQTFPSSLEREVPRGMARLLVPKGHYQYVDIIQPGEYAGYINLVLEWISWINSSPTERLAFYKESRFDPKQRLDVSAELRKINCFNYIVENTVLSRAPNNVQGTSKDLSPISPTKREACNELDAIVSRHLSSENQINSHLIHLTISNKSDSLMSLKCVQDALTRTSLAIKDIDAVLATNGSTKPVKDV